MEDSLIIQTSPLFVFWSSKFETKGLTQSKNVNLDADDRAAENLSSLNIADNNLFSEDSVEPIQTPNPALTNAIPSDANNNIAKQKPTSIINKIKQSSPKFMRKQIVRNSKPTLILNLSGDNNNEDSQNIRIKKSSKDTGSLSPRITRKKLNEENEGASSGRSSPQNLPVEQDVCTENGLSLAKKNWRKVKLALRKLKDNGENQSSTLLSNHPSPSDSSILNTTSIPELENRMKAFLSNDKVKSKAGSPKSPRMKPKYGSNMWPVSEDSNFLRIPRSDTEMDFHQTFSLNPSSFSAFAKGKKHPFAGFRRRSAPDTVLRQNLEAFHTAKRSKEGKLRLQSKHIQNKNKPNLGRVLASSSDEEIKDKMFFILRENLHSFEHYIPEESDRLGRIISENITKYLHSIEAPNECPQKYVCLVYIGAVRDCGIYVGARALCSPKEDRFLVADYQKNNIYGIAIVLGIPS